MLLPGLKFILSFISIVISSWLLIHLLGAFGVFIAFAYPIWFLIAKDKTSCILCNLGKEGTKCKFCQTTIDKSNQSPKNIKSVGLNTLLILLLSIFSACLIYLEYNIIVKFKLVGSTRTVRFLLDSGGKTPTSAYSIGEVFEMRVQLLDIRSPINVIQSDIAFDPNLLEVEDIVTTDSIASIFIEKNIKNDIGFARLSGGIPNPGFTGDVGLFAKVRFKAKAPGLAEVKFLPTSVVLANDGYGTNVLKEIPSTGFLILDQKVDEYKSSSVLGDSRDPTKLYLYDEKQVLGASTTAADIALDESNKRINITNILFYVISEIDHLIVNMWMLVITAFTNIISFIFSLFK